jgi:hypothetical protein
MGEIMSDNLFAPGPRPSASLDKPTKHNFSCGGGSTEYCEDREWGKAQRAFIDNEKKLIATRRHAATEDAIARARTVLTEEDWDLLGIKVAPYRDIDRIVV